MTTEQKRFFRKVNKKVAKMTLTRGEVFMVDHGFLAGWSVETVVGKINSGHGNRWV
jgi:hypothetical protein